MTLRKILCSRTASDLLPSKHAAFAVSSYGSTNTTTKISVGIVADGLLL